MIPQSGSHCALSVVIPLYNEAETLPLLVTKLLEVLAHEPAFLEVVLVDDGSQDRTAALAQELAAREPRLRLVQHAGNRGLGAAIRTGLAAAAGDLILYTDADLPFDFHLIPQLLARAGERNVVIGYRLNRGEGARRWVLTKGYNLLCRLLLGVRVHDVNFACKLLPRAAVRQMQLGAEGSFIDAEILLECRRLGFEISEFPLTYFPRTLGQSTLSRPAVILGIVSELIAYFQRTWRAQTPPLELPVEVQPDYHNEI
ncbi:MAG: glycosyltransferase family 2 protein [Acidobacteria bacterium]|nr:glycosyltransferase family 2 protein [Acidobacteriota bacterium]MBI3421537.1 glycosyltransferase family 2 protein [Acidobacteriota bacterium]